MRRRGITDFILVFLIFLVSTALILYPFIANYVFEHRTDSIVQAVEVEAGEIKDSIRQSELERAYRYNEMIASGHIRLQDPFVEQKEDLTQDYASLLNMTEDGVMGFIRIPSIDVSLPVYHGTAEHTLEAGAGHLQGSSLPVGGRSTHSVITGHTGLSSAKLFTDLIELGEGDIFTLNIYGKRLVYEVDQIKTVLPYELEDLAIVPGQDLCTLVTCTPYGINTHRLLVRGVRTEEAESNDNAEIYKAKLAGSIWMQEYKRDVLISFGSLILGMASLAISGIIHNRRGKRRPEHVNGSKP